MITILERDPCIACANRARCRVGLACQAFATFVETGRPLGDHIPRPDLFARLFPDDARLKAPTRGRSQPARKLAVDDVDGLIAKLAALRRRWHRESIERHRQVRLGRRAPLTAAERSIQRRSRRAQRWRIDPRLRERYLRLKREDATRRARRNGVAPAGSEGQRLHRIEGQRRRRQAERERNGRILTGPQFKALRMQLGMTIWDVALEMSVTYSAAKQWQRALHGPPGRAVAWLAAVAAGKVQLNRGRQPTARGQAIWLNAIR